MELTPASLHITADAVRTYAEITQDFNPIHLDAAFAEATPLKGVIAHGTLSLALIWRALERTPSIDTGAWSLEVRFVKPVRLGDTVTAGGRTNADGSCFDVWVKNAKEEPLITGTARPTSPSMSPPTQQV